ncbi:MAG: EF-hand domain-containing protein [Pirellulales bacterium]|nr:EF-hand domain-containing protein [Pirellulales bacterium]
MAFIRTLSAMIVLAWLGAPALADEPGDGAPPQNPPAQPGEDPAALFAEMDTNQDGFVSRDEIPEAKRRLFRRLMTQGDKDGDERLSKDEFVAGLESNRPDRPLPDAQAMRERRRQAGGPPGEGQPGRPDPGQLFTLADANGDGVVTEDELPEERRGMFAMLVQRGDRDGDGAMSRDEFLTAMRELRPGGPPSGDGPPGRPDGPSGDPLGRRLMEALDSDGDHALSSSELAAAGEALKKLDLDGDGAVSEQELHGPPGRPGRPGAGDGPPGIEQLVARIMQTDSDGDGLISESECPPRLQQAFGRLDANGDGGLDETELKNGAQAIARFMQKKGKDAKPPVKKKKKPAGDTSN